MGWRGIMCGCLLCRAREHRHGICCTHCRCVCPVCSKEKGWPGAPPPEMVSLSASAVLLESSVVEVQTCLCLTLVVQVQDCCFAQHRYI